MSALNVREAAALAVAGSRRLCAWRSAHVFVDETPADEALALRLAVALHSPPEMLAVVHIVLDDVLCDLLLRDQAGSWWAQPP